MLESFFSRKCVVSTELCHEPIKMACGRFTLAEMCGREKTHLNEIPATVPGEMMLSAGAGEVAEEMEFFG